MLELLPAELQISSLLGKQPSSCLLGQSTGFVQLCSVIQLAVAEGECPKSCIKRWWLDHLGCSGEEVPARNLQVVTFHNGKAQLARPR